MSTYRYLLIIFLSFLLFFSVVQAQSNSDLSTRLSGRIVLQVEQRGEAWYITDSGERIYLKNAQRAFELLRSRGIGISDEDIAGIPYGFYANSQNGINDQDKDGISDAVEEALGTDVSNADSDGDGYTDAIELEHGYSPLGSGKQQVNQALVNRLRGKIVLQVKNKGQAWYIHPDDGRRYFLGKPDDALTTMRYLSLGVTDENLDQIAPDEDDADSVAQEVAYLEVKAHGDDTLSHRQRLQRLQARLEKLKKSKTNTVTDTEQKNVIYSEESANNTTDTLPDVTGEREESSESGTLTEDGAVASEEINSEITTQETTETSESDPVEESEETSEAEVEEEPAIEPVDPLTLLPNEALEMVYDEWEDPTGEDVLLVYNTNYVADENQNGVADGLDIVQYYKAYRAVPDNNICPIAVTPSEVIPLEEFDEVFDTMGAYQNHLRQQIEYCLDQLGVKYLVDYIVLTRGVPLKVNNATVRMSVGQGLVELYQDHEYGKQLLSYPDNPVDSYYKFFKSHQPDTNLTYLVTRLDGYTVSDITAMINRSVNAAQHGQFAWVIDDDTRSPVSGMPSLRQVHGSLSDLDQFLYPEIWPDDATTMNEWITSTNQPVMGYVSHGIHATMPDGYISNVLDFSYENGAIFSTYESFNGWGFVSPTQSTHGQVAEFIAEGGSGGIGNVYEPFSSAIANEYYFFRRYYNGNTFAEAAYSSLEYVNWMSTVVGDPLMRIAPYPLPENSTPSSDTLSLDLKVFLQGPYSAANDEMWTTLNDLGWLPTTAPYQRDQRSIAEMPDSITDWVSVELRKTRDAAPVISKSVLLRKDGKVVGDDGVSEYITFNVDAGEYYVVLKHRNHLGVMSATKLNFENNGLTSYDFTTAQSQAYGAISPMNEIEPGVFGLVSGDANGDGGIDSVDENTYWRPNNGTVWDYSKGADFNLDGGIDALDKNLYYNPNKTRATQVPNVV